MNPSDAVFIGRHREIAELEAALEEALSGHGRVVMLAGQPGIGKTRTAQELAAIAEQRGAKTLWGWCYEGEGAPPYWPWVQPIRSYVNQGEPEQLRSEIGPGASDISGIVPEIRAKLTDLEPSPSLEPEQARFRLFDSIATFLNRASENQPLVLVMDDLHWADRSSLLLLEFLARQLGEARILVVGCYRDVELSRQHPLSETLAQLSREPAFQRVTLGGLSYEDAASLIEAMAGIRPSQRLTETIHAQTEGNPFFMTEVVRLLVEHGELTTEDIGAPQGIRVPEGVREVIGQRLNRLSDQCNRTLAVASVIGREFGLDLLERLTEEESLLEVLEEAIRARVVEEVPGQVGRYQFAHALIQQTLAEELSISRRVRVHARIGEVLEDLYGADIEAHAAELAHHFAASETVTGAGRLVRYSLMAGEQALAKYAYEDSLAHFTRALQSREDEQTGDILFGLGRAEAALLRIDDALSHLRQAFNYYVDTEDITKAVAVAEVTMTGGAGYAGMAALIERALDLVRADSIEAGRLLSRHLRYLGITKGDYESAQQSFEQALSIAERENDLYLKIRTLTNFANVNRFHQKEQMGLEISLLALRLAKEIDTPWDDSLNHNAGALTLAELGDPQGARLHCLSALATAERLRDRERISSAYWVNQSLAMVEGDWRAARRFGGRALASWPNDARVVAVGALVECEIGDFDQADFYISQLLEVMDKLPASSHVEYSTLAAVIPEAVRITGFTEHLEVAEIAASAVINAYESVPRHVTCSMRGLALIAVQKNDIPLAVEQYQALKNMRGRMLDGHLHFDRVLGLLAQTIGKIDDAIDHFEGALAFCRRAGYRPELAWTCYDYAEMLLSRNGLGDHQKAMSLVDEALFISTELGMKPLVERVAALQERAASLPAKAPVYPAGLTAREVEVLLLIAHGKTTREIADALVISPRTVQRHTTNLYAKINARNRVEATAFALNELTTST